MSRSSTTASMTGFDCSKLLSRRTAAVEEAAIIRMAQRARDLRAQGRDVISLTLGEPDFDTPRHIQAAANEAMRKGYTHYAPVPGIPLLREAIARKLRSENGLDYAAGQIVLSNGAKQAVTNAMFATIDPGDEAVFLAPFWVAYEGILRMAGGVPVVLPSDVSTGFKVPPSHIARAITPKTKLLILNFPNNPSGAVYEREALKQIAEVIRDHHQMLVISDEIYEYISYGGTLTSFGSLPGMIERTITVNGFSKAFAMTGWRLGYAAAPEAVARAMAKVQGTFTAGANAFVQHAAIAALEGGREDVERMRETYRRRRAIVMEQLRNIDGVTVQEPEGTFYAFPDVSQWLRKVTHLGSVDELCDWLLENHGLALVPGSAFGDANCVRISFAASEADIAEGLRRLRVALG
ncbi:MAG TPA: pyridoxal phosphate-dependent aminotransferase [Aestuariivirgaceae bacterium]